MRSRARAGCPAHMSWARLLKRVFDIDIEHCPNSGGSLKIIAAIEHPSVIVKILSHLGLPARAPPRLRRGDSIYSKRLKSPNRLPTQADGAGRSEFERAPRRRANRALPTAASPEPSKATPGFSLNARALDGSRVRLYSSGQKKRWFKIPIPMQATYVSPDEERIHHAHVL